MTDRFDVVVLGGGVTGLVAALRLAGTARVALLEAGDALGGKLRTGELRGHPLDLGPDAFLTRRPAARALCEELGLAADLVAPATSGAALFARGRLRPLPRGLALGVPTDLWALARSGVVGPAGVARAALDLVLPGRAAPAGLLERLEAGGPDPTIADIVGGRLGPDVLEALAGPLLGGINAGDARRLSFAATAPGLAGLAAGRRSLLRALRPAASTPDQARRLPPFLGLRQGLGGLAAALGEAVVTAGVEVRTGWAATALRRERDRLVVEAAAGTIEAHGAVVALPAHAAAPLLGPLCRPAADALAQVPYASVATCALAWPTDVVPPSLGRSLAALARSGEAGRDADQAARAALLPGSGFLVARPATGGLVTAVTFTSTKWPGSVPAGLVGLRASVGRHGDDRHRRLGDAALVAAVAGEIAEMTGIRATPVEAVVQRWPDSFPQHVAGHRARIARARAMLRADQGGRLALAGAAYDGIGIPACIESGAAAAAELASALGG